MHAQKHLKQTQYQLKKALQLQVTKKQAIKKETTVLNRGMLVANEIGHSAEKKPEKNQVNI